MEGGLPRDQQDAQGAPRIDLGGLARRRKQHRQAVGGHPSAQLHRPAQELRVKPHADVPRPEPLGPVQQHPRPGRLAGVPGSLRGGGEAAGTPLVREAELRRALEGGGRGGVTRAPQRPLRRALELARDLLVRAPGRKRPVPGPPVRLCLATLQRLRQRAVHRPALGGSRAVIDRRADQRVAEPDRRALDAQQVPKVRRPEQPRVEPEPDGRAADRADLARPVGGRGQHQRLHLGRAPSDAPEERALELPGQGQRLAERRQPPGLPVGARAGKLEQRQRVPAAGAQDPLADGGIERAPALVEQRGGGARVQAREPKLRQARRADTPALAVPDRQHESDRLTVDAPREEGQRVERGRVRPLGVVHQAQHGPLACGLRQQCQQGDRHQEPVRAGVRAKPERRQQRAPLWLGQRLGPVEHRAHELVRRGEGELGLGLDRDGPQDAHVMGPLSGIRQQRRLPDARLAADREGSALSRPDVIEHAVDRGLLLLPTAKHGPSIPFLSSEQE